MTAAQIFEVGERYGRWTVTERRQSGRRVQCHCDCGATGSPFVHGLTDGTSTSCGCARRERFAVQIRSHGRTDTPTYRSWCCMKQRCGNPKDPSYGDYGGRGISVCSRWVDSFENFLADMGERPPGRSLDRADNERGYEPGNCRWATRAEQNGNCRPRKKAEACGRGHKYVPGSYRSYQRSGYTQRQCVLCEPIRAQNPDDRIRRPSRERS